MWIYTINYIIIIVHAQTRYAGSLWIPDLDLRYRDRAVVKRGKLYDKHMYAAHEVLRYQFPHLHGLQSTLLTQKEFKAIQCHDSVVRGKG